MSEVFFASELKKVEFLEHIIYAYISHKGIRNGRYGFMRENHNCNGRSEWKNTAASVEAPFINQRQPSIGQWCEGRYTQNLNKW